MLNKYYLLIAIGDKLSPEQTHEVLLRTSDLEDVFEREEYKTILNDLGIEKYKGRPLQFLKSIKPLELYYLDNEQFVSSYFGGLHGWLNWEGNIRASSFDCGKYPTEKKLEKEVKLLTSTFPFLNMWFQFLPLNERGNATSLVPSLSFYLKDGDYTKYGEGKVELKLKPTKSYNPHSSDKSVFQPKYNPQLLKEVVNRLQTNT